MSDSSSAPLFRLTVAAHTATSVSLHIVSVYGEQDVSFSWANESFVIKFLGFLLDPSAIAAIPDDPSGAIASIHTTVQRTGRSLSAKLHVEVAQSAWLGGVRARASRIKEGSWISDTVDILMESSYWEPIASGAAAKPIEDSGYSFLYLPRAAWSDMVETDPALFEVPAYPPREYTTRDVIVKPKTIPVDWIGRAVRILGGAGQTIDGGLFIDGRLVMVAQADSSGLKTVGFVGAHAIARLVPKDGRRSSKFTYAKVFDHVKARPISTRRDGEKIELAFRIPPGNRELLIRDKASVLHYLHQVLFQEDGCPMLKGVTSELEKALDDDAKRLGIKELGDVIARVADNYIADYTITYAPGKNLDTLSPAEVRAIVLADWPIAKLLITATHAKWITHLAEVGPNPVGTRAIRQ
ncbi:hypothetical protein ACQP2T_05860 [Nonomuraea sp. CA-143628]|uniref:hypothetical protein n=1 Tax=Nonomuraea sp. CA-143628 TaxID=3239997 RepID=UPI003D8FEF4A